MDIRHLYRTHVPEGVREIANATMTGASIGAFTGGAAAVARRFSLAAPGVVMHDQPHRSQHQAHEQARRSGHQQHAHGQHQARHGHHNGTWYR